MLTHAMKAFESPALPAAWAECNLAFLRCTQDQAVPAVLRDTFIQRSGVEWMVKDVEAGHSPWASCPEEVVKILDEWVSMFQDRDA